MKRNARHYRTADNIDAIVNNYGRAATETLEFTAATNGWIANVYIMKNRGDYII